MSNPSAVTSGVASARRVAWRSVGLWMSIVLIGYILFNAVRSALDPMAFATYYGLPLNSTDNNAFVFVYSIRALFLGLFGLALLLRRNYAALALFVLVGSIMPIGDAILVALRGGGVTIVLRHGLIAGFLLLTWYFVRRLAQPTSPTR